MMRIKKWIRIIKKPADTLPPKSTRMGKEPKNQ